MESDFNYKILKKLLDREFKNTEYIEGYFMKDLREPWDVILHESGEILIGGAVGGGEWFYDGTKLSYLINLLNVTPGFIAEGIKKYVNEKYNLNIKSVV